MSQFLAYKICTILTPVTRRVTRHGQATSEVPLNTSASYAPICNASLFSLPSYLSNFNYSVLFDDSMQNNLGICGLWIPLDFVDGHQTEQDKAAFLPLGLDYNDRAYTAQLRDSVSAALSELYKTVTTGTYLDGHLPESCGSSALFWTYLVEN